MPDSFIYAYHKTHKDKFIPLKMNNKNWTCIIFQAQKLNAIRR